VVELGLGLCESLVAEEKIDKEIPQSEEETDDGRHHHVLPAPLLHQSPLHY